MKTTTTGACRRRLVFVREDNEDEGQDEQEEDAFPANGDEGRSEMKTE